MPRIILSGKLHFLEVFFTKRPPPGANDRMTKAKDEEIDNTDLKHLPFIDNRWLKGANNI